MATKTKVENDNEILEENEFVEDRHASASKNKKEKNAKKNGEKKKGGFFSLFLFAVLVGLLVAILVFNAGDIREKYLRGTLEKIPVVKNLLPEKEGADEFSGLSNEALASEARALNEKNKKLENEKIALNDEIVKLNDEMKRLKEIEANQIAFKEEKESFDRMIAENDPNAYQAFYESIEPDTAKSIYEDIINASLVDQDVKKYVQTFENMKKDAAAKVLEEMMSTDMELVVQILNNISSEQRANILAAMEPQNAAACARQMAP